MELLHPTTAIYIHDKRINSSLDGLIKEEEPEKAKILMFQRFCEFILQEKPQLMVEVLW